MANNPYQAASQAYQKKNDDTLTPLQIVVELYKGMIKNTKLAKKYWEDKQFDVMCIYIEKNFNILEALQSNIDLENGGEDAVFLNRFYTVIFSSLTLATTKPDPSAYFDEIVAYIQQVHDRWYVLAYPGAALPQAQEASATT